MALDITEIKIRDKVTIAGTEITSVETTLTGGNSALPRADAVKAYVDNLLNANDAMQFKGTIGTGGTVTALPTTHSAGWTFRVITAATYAGVVTEVGDLIIAVIDRAGTGNANSDWTVVQTNIDGAVVGPASAVSANIARFNGTSGKLIQDSGISFETTLTTGSDAKSPTSKAVATYVTGLGYTTNTGTVTGVTGTAPIASSGGTAPVISITAATTSAAGSMSSADKTKLDGIATGATANTGTVTSVSAGTQISGMAMTITNGTTTPSIATSVSNAANFRTAIGAGTGNGTVTAVTGTAPIVSSGGTAPAISISAATTSAAGSMSSADKTKLDGIASGATANTGTVTGVTGTAPIVSSGGTAPAISISAATTSVAGSMSSADKTKLDGIAAGAQVNVATNLAQGTRTTTAVPVTSSTGTSATLDIATTSLAGVMSSADKTKLDGIATGAQVNVGTNLTWTAGTTAGPTVNSSTGTGQAIPSASISASGAVTTGAQEFAGNKTFRAATTQDGIVLAGRAGGTGSFGVTLTPTTLTASRTLTLPNAEGTVALTSQIPAAANNATLSLTATAGATNTSVTIGTGTGFSANDSTNRTYDIDVGPALTNLATTMTGAGTGILRKTAADTYEVVANTTYLTAHPTITTTTDTTTTASPAFGGTFTAIDGVTRDTNGHVTTLNTKTVTIPTPSYPTVNNATLTIAASTGISLSATPTFTANASADKTITITNSAPHVGTNLGIIGGTTAGPTVTSTTGTNATIPSAGVSNSGVITTGAQSISGVKTLENSFTGASGTSTIITSQVIAGALPSAPLVATGLRVTATGNSVDFHAATGIVAKAVGGLSNDAIVAYGLDGVYIAASDSSAGKSLRLKGVSGTSAGTTLQTNSSTSSSITVTLPSTTGTLTLNGHTHTYDDLTGTVPTWNQSTTGNAANVTGVVAVANGGTGQTTLALARNAMGLGNTTGALPVANGGTGTTTHTSGNVLLGAGTNAITSVALRNLTALGQLSSSGTAPINERAVYFGTHQREINVSAAIASSTSFTTMTFTSGMRDFWLYIHQDTTTGSVIAQIPLTITSAQSIGTASPGKQHRVAWSNGSVTQVMNVDIFFSGTTLSFRHNFTGANLAFRWFGY